MTGWEIDERATACLMTDQHAPIEDFVRRFGPLAAFDAAARTLVVIRRWHPTLNVSDADPDYACGDHSVRVALYVDASSSFRFLPKTLTYRGIALAPNGSDGFHASDLLITTTEHGTTRTNAWELERRLSKDFAALPEAAMLAAFATLENRRQRQPRAPAVTAMHVETASVGRLDRDPRFDDVWRTSVDVPLVGQPLEITLGGYNPQDPRHAGHLERADRALAAFLALDDAARARAAGQVLRHCHDTLDAIGIDDWNREMADLRDAAHVWRHVTLTGVRVCVDRGRAYVCLLGECAWDEEHGLQLVYRDGARLSRVSAQDGHVTGE